MNETLSSESDQAHLEGNYAVGIVGGTTIRLLVGGVNGTPEETMAKLRRILVPPQNENSPY